MRNADVPNESWGYGPSKRAFDLIIGLVGLFLLVPVTPMLGLLIKLDSRGPIFYVQWRVGRGGRPFRLVKFRTMYLDAEADGRPRLAQKHDPRITRVGRWLRATGLDELPQAIHIIKGEMSLIGPRPERPELEKKLQHLMPAHSLRYHVRPGLIGWAQLHQDTPTTEAELCQRFSYDLYYLANRSLALDVWILCNTPCAIVKRCLQADSTVWEHPSSS